MKTIKTLLLLSTLVISLKADIYKEFTTHLNNKNYVLACIAGKQIISKQEKSEKFLSIIGQVCLKADFINSIALLEGKLRKSKEARTNAVLFSSVILQKRLIYQFMYDDVDISTLALPISDHILSYTFVAIRDKNYTVVSKNPKIIEFKREDKHYKVYIKKKDKRRVIIEVRDKRNKMTKHRYL